MDGRWTSEEIASGEVHCHRVVREIHTERSRFQRIEVLETEGYGPGLFLDGRVQHVQADEYTYSESMVHPAMLFLGGRADRVLCIGGGPGGVVRELLRYRGVRRVVQVDIDPTVIEVSRRHLRHVAPEHWDDPRFELVIDDALHYLAATADRFDLVINDLSEPLPGSPAAAVFTEDACRLIASRLAGERACYVTWAGSVGCRSAGIAVAINRLVGATFSHSAAYVTHPQSYGTVWLTVIGSLSPLEPLRLRPEEIDVRIAETVDGELTLYDGITHHHMFLLPRDVRALLAAGAGGGTGDSITLDVAGDR